MKDLPDVNRKLVKGKYSLLYIKKYQKISSMIRNSSATVYHFQREKQASLAKAPLPRGWHPLLTIQHHKWMLIKLLPAVLLRSS